MGYTHKTPDWRYFHIKEKETTDKRYINRRTKTRYTLDSKLTNLWSIKESTKMWYIRKINGYGLHQFSNKIGVYHSGYGFKVYPYQKEVNNGLEVHRNRHQNIRYTLNSKLTNCGYINVPTKLGYMILDADSRYIHMKKKETTD